MDALAKEVAPFGIKTTVVNPGFVRTELLTERSALYADAAIEDYDDARAEQMAWWVAQDGRQSGDPAKLADALVALAHLEAPPRRLIAGSDVVSLAEQKIAELQQQIDADRDLAASLAFDDSDEEEDRSDRPQRSLPATRADRHRQRLARQRSPGHAGLSLWAVQDSNLRPPACKA